MRSCIGITAFVIHLNLAQANSTSTNATTTTNSTQLVGYVQDPNGRGTISLLLSCVLTLILCVWSALHLNVPAPDQTKVKDIWLNTRWIITGIYAPELVVFAAWRQWCSAKLLQTIVAGCSDSSHSSDSETDNNDKPPDQFEWTMTHSFFACTGGFAFDIDGFAPVDAEKDDQEGRLPQRLTLTARGVALLARCGRLPRVDRGDIEDKSKANNLAKAAVVTQATWLLIQVIGRLAAGLTVTLLEVNTVAHVYVLRRPFSERISSMLTARADYVPSPCTPSGGTSPSFPTSPSSSATGNSNPSPPSCIPAAK